MRCVLDDRPRGEVVHAGGLLDHDPVAGCYGRRRVRDVLLGAVYLVFPNPLAGVGFPPGAVALWSMFISIIALPHTLVGLVFDTERGIWYVP